MRFPITTLVFAALLGGFTSCNDSNKSTEKKKSQTESTSEGQGSTTDNEDKNINGMGNDAQDQEMTGDVPVNASPDLPKQGGPNASENVIQEAKSQPEDKEYDPAQDQATNEMALMVFEEEVYDFGTMNEGESVTHIFQFTNGGNVPLLLTNCNGSCGCTVPQCPKAPIMPGEGGEIEVKFNSKGKKNAQTKTVTINANIPGGQKLLTIRANVTPAN